jgi:hypothetical protein
MRKRGKSRTELELTNVTCHVEASLSCETCARSFNLLNCAVE